MVVTCVCVNVYRDDLMRGQKYEVVEENLERCQVRVKGGNGRLRWFPSKCFDFGNQPVLTLTDWQFDIEIDGNSQAWIPEIKVAFSDGSQRFCLVATPQTIVHLLVGLTPYFWDSHLIIVPNYAPEIVDKALRDLDAQGNLLEASYSIELSEPQDETFQDPCPEGHG